MNKIKVYLSHGEMDEWGKDECDDCKLTHNYFVVIRANAWVGFYPLNSVYKIIKE